LVRRSFERWYTLEQEAGRRLLTECACLNLGPPDRELIQGVRRSCEEHRLPVEILTAADVRRRFPVFRPEDHWVGVLEQTAGVLGGGGGGGGAGGGGGPTGRDDQPPGARHRLGGGGPGRDGDDGAGDVPRRGAGDHRRSVGGPGVGPTRDKVGRDAPGDALV